jgi:hypothetical protein
MADDQFTRVRAYIEQAGYASDPERMLIAALDASAHFGVDFAVGLYLCAHLDSDDLDLLCLLSNHITWNRYGRVAFNYRDAARKRLAERYCEGWKADPKGQRMRVEKRAVLLKERWGDVSTRLQEHYRTIQQALKGSRHFAEIA